jgi:hypothetical protein
METFEDRVLKYSKAELTDVLSNIDREKFPDRYEIARRRYDEIKDDPAYGIVDPSEKYQTGMRRFWAMSLDGFFVQILAVVLFYSFGSFLGSDESSDFEFYISPVYMVWLTAVFGKTLGKHICRIKVVSYPEENRIGIRSSVMREIFPIGLVCLSLPLTLISGFTSFEVPSAALIASGMMLAIGSMGWLFLNSLHSTWIKS